MPTKREYLKAPQKMPQMKPNEKRQEAMMPGYQTRPMKPPVNSRATPYQPGKIQQENRAVRPPEKPGAGARTAEKLYKQLQKQITPSYRGKPR